MALQTCVKCSQPKETTEFPVNRAATSGYHSWCKFCMSEYGRAQYLANRGKRLKQTAEYRRLHPEISRASTKKWKETHPEEYRRSLEKSYPKRLQSQNQRRANNRAAHNKYHREWKARPINKAKISQWRKEHRDEHRQKQKLWRQQNRETCTASSERRRARERDAPGRFTGAEFKSLKDKYENRCLACGQSKPLTVDHVVPLSKGGSNAIENIQPLCKSCNSAKHDQTIDYRINQQAA